MAEVKGLTGLRPSPEMVQKVTSPPYDVIKVGSSLESLLKSNSDSLYHIILGESPKETLDSFIEKEILISEEEPGLYVYQQDWGTGSRLGFFGAVKVDDYSEKNIIRHEKTFDEKVKGRIALAKKTEHTIGPILLLTASSIQNILEDVIFNQEPEYVFQSDFDGNTDLHGISNRVFKVLEDSENGKKIKQAISQNPLYIADGHHRYHAALKNEQTHTLAYIVQDAKIQAYNRVINGKKTFSDILGDLDLEKVDDFMTPPKNSFCIHSKQGTYMLKAQSIPNDVVGKLDCSILEKELYSKLDISHDMILDQKYFDYYAESELETMRNLVEDGKYDIAVALNPVTIQELMDVANAGLEDSEIVMPEKSTFFSPKILSGLFLYKHQSKVPA